MLVGLKVINDAGEQYFIRINPFHVVRISIFNPKNPDEGSYILLRTGEEIYSPEPIDIIDLRLHDVINRFTAQVLLQIINDYAETVQPKKRGRPRSAK